MKLFNNIYELVISNWASNKIVLHSYYGVNPIYRCQIYKGYVQILILLSEVHKERENLVFFKVKIVHMYRKTQYFFPASFCDNLANNLLQLVTFRVYDTKQQELRRLFMYTTQSRERNCSYVHIINVNYAKFQKKFDSRTISKELP